MNRLEKIKELSLKCYMILFDFNFWQNLHYYTLLIQYFLLENINGE